MKTKIQQNKLKLFLSIVLMLAGGVFAYSQVGGSLNAGNDTPKENSIQSGESVTISHSEEFSFGAAKIDRKQKGASEVETVAYSEKKTVNENNGENSNIEFKTNNSGEIIEIVFNNKNIFSLYEKNPFISNKVLFDKSGDYPNLILPTKNNEFYSNYFNVKKDHIKYLDVSAGIDISPEKTNYIAIVYNCYLVDLENKVSLVSKVYILNEQGEIKYEYFNKGSLMYDVSVSDNGKLISFDSGDVLDINENIVLERKIRILNLENNSYEYENIISENKIENGMFYANNLWIGNSYSNIYNYEKSKYDSRTATTLIIDTKNIQFYSKKYNFLDFFIEKKGNSIYLKSKTDNSILNYKDF